MEGKESILDMIVYDPKEFAERNLAYLKEKYGKEFGISMSVTNTLNLENVVTAYCKEDETEFFNVKCKCCSDKNYHFYDNYMNIVLSKTEAVKLKQLAEKHSLGTIKCFLQGWASSEYGDKDADINLSEKEQFEIAGSHGGIWHIYMEYGGTPEEFSAVKDKLVEDIRSEKLYGTYYIYCVAENALLLMDKENYRSYLPKKRAADGKICTHFSRNVVKKEVQ